MRGIDISPYQGNVDFNAVKKSGIEIVYIKATEGKTFVANTLKNYYYGAKEVGLKVGFYHYLKNNNPIDEANNYINAIEGLTANCLHAIDAEVTLNQNKNQISANIVEFGNYLEAKGYPVCVYTYTSFFSDYLNDSVSKFPLWIAEYGVRSPNISKSYVGFQYSETGNCPGINGYVDLDEFKNEILINKGDLDMIDKLIVYFGEVDLFSAIMLSQKYQCPVMKLSDYQLGNVKAKQVIQVGGNGGISGSDRFETFKKVAQLL